MNKIILGLLVGAVMAGPAAAQNMPLRTFVQKGTSLEKKGPLAVFSMGEVKRLQKEISASAPLLRAERLASIQAGRKPAYCPPDKGQAVGPKELIAEFRAVAPTLPASATVKDGMRAFLARKYPCPA